MQPRISVLMPVRNGLPWLKDALEGIARQTMADFEILALEDGSTDATAEFLRGWGDDRLRVISTGGVGVAAALGIGLDQARAPLVARHDADDVSVPERFAAQVEYLATRTDVAVVASIADYIDAESRPVDNAWVATVRRQQDVAVTPDQIRDLMPLTCCITHGSVMARAGVLRAAGGYRQWCAPAEDYDLWLRLLPRTPIAKLSERLYQYRLHGAQVSATANQHQLYQALAAKFRYLRRVCPGLPSPARLVVVGEGRGAVCYRSLASAHGFDVIPRPAVLGPGKLGLLENRIVRRWTLDCCDAIVVTDFDSLDAYGAALTAGTVAGDPDGGAVRIGNFFVPRRWAERRAA